MLLHILIAVAAVIGLLLVVLVFVCWGAALDTRRMEREHYRDR